jgi:DNA invertase Pin-like site-specific DNA recombinase
MKNHKLTDALAGSKGRACVYSRISNPNDKRDRSLDSQEEATVAVLRGMGYTVDDEDIFRERETGKDTDRPVLAHIKDLMRAGRYKAIGFYCLDRFVRSQVHTAILFDELDKLGVKPISATNDIGDNTPEGKLILAIRAYLAESERIKIEERMMRGKRRVQEEGKYLKLGITRMGFVWDKDKRTRTAHPEEAPVVVGIFTSSAAGESNNRIAKRLNTAGVPTPSASRKKRGIRVGVWTANLIRDILQDPAYKGWTVMNRWRIEKAFNAETMKKTRKLIQLPQEEWTILDREGIVTERIVDDGLWEEANRAMTERHRNAASSKVAYAKSGVHLLRGIAFCGSCGHKMYPQHCTATPRRKDGSKQPPRPSYLCQTRHKGWLSHHPEIPACGMPLVRSVPMDEAVWAQFRAVVITPGLLEEAVERLAERTDTAGPEAEIESARAVLAAKEKTRNTLYDRWRREQDDADGDPDFRDKLEADYRAMRPIIDAHRQAVKEMEARLTLTLRAPGTVDAFRDRFEVLRERLIEHDDTTWAERWEALRLAEARVIMTPGSFDLYLDLFGECDAKPDGTSGSSIQFSNALLVGGNLSLATA